MIYIIILLYNYRMNAVCSTFKFSMMCSIVVVCNTMWCLIVCVIVSGAGELKTNGHLFGLEQTFWHCFSSLFHFIGCNTRGTMREHQHCAKMDTEAKMILCYL